MMSQAAPITETPRPEAEAAFMAKDAAFVSVYNDGDISEYLYTTPAFASGFLPLEPEDEKQHAHATAVNIKSTRHPTETFNTGTSPTSTTEKQVTALPTPVKSAMKTQTRPAAKAVERRPSFIEVTLPHAHHGHEHEHEHKAHHEQRRHSSESHLPMNWWPEPEDKTKHEWEDEDVADEEEDVMEEAFYASYD